MSTSDRPSTPGSWWRRGPHSPAAPHPSGVSRSLPRGTVPVTHLPFWCPSPSLLMDRLPCRSHIGFRPFRNPRHLSYRQELGEHMLTELQRVHIPPVSADVHPVRFPDRWQRLFVPVGAVELGMRIGGQLERRFRPDTGLGSFVVEDAALIHQIQGARKSVFTAPDRL